MQQPPRTQRSHALQPGRTTPALSRVMPSAVPVSLPAASRQRWLQLPVDKRVSTLRRLCCELLLVGLALGLCYWLLGPLPGKAQPASPAAHLLPTLAPWLPMLYWTRLPWLVAAVSHVSWLDVRGEQPVAVSNLALLLLLAALLLLWLAARLCQRAVRERLSQRAMTVLLLQVCLLTIVFGVSFILLPAALTQETVLSGLAGRAALVYRINPYLLARAGGALAHDSLFQALVPGSFAAPQTMGPIWLDLTVPLSWLAQGKPGLVVLVWRICGLGLHLLNALLLWASVGKLKPTLRLPATLLYAWNPVFLLLGIVEMQASLAVIALLLLAIVLWQHHLLLLSWVALVLAALIQPLCLLLLPLFLRLLIRETRLLTRGSSALWWVGLLCVCALVISLAYAPYWSGLGSGGIAQYLRASLWPDALQNSQLAALHALPFASWPPAAWLLALPHWLGLLGLLVAGLLLLGVWVTDNLELALLFASWIWLVLVLLFPGNQPWLILPALALSLASASRRTVLLAHLLSAGALLSYGLAFWPVPWGGQALVTLGLPALIWGWLLFFASTWQMTHHDEQEAHARLRRPGISRPSWPPRPAAWPSRPGRQR